MGRAGEIHRESHGVVSIDLPINKCARTIIYVYIYYCNDNNENAHGPSENEDRTHGSEKHQ